MRANLRLLVWLCVLSLAGWGCANPLKNPISRDGIMSQDLPLTVNDLLEIREGEDFYRDLLLEDDSLYTRYESPKLENYLNALTKSIAKVSDRPNLPYQIVILDDEDVNMFGGPGGYIFVSRGFLDFVESEAELAGAIAHEVAHIAGLEYSSIPQVPRMRKAYNLMLKGTELAKDSIGTYGTAANYGLKGIRKATPYVQKRFAKDQEVVADSKVVNYLMKAGYDPHGYQEFVERISRIPMDEVNQYVLYLHKHPPFPDRRVVLEEEISNIDFSDAKIEFRKDMLNEVRQLSVNTPAGAGDSIIFSPIVDPHPGNPIEIHDVTTGERSKFTMAARKRYGWF